MLEIDYQNPTKLARLAEMRRRFLRRASEAADRAQTRLSFKPRRDLNKGRFYETPRKTVWAMALQRLS